MNAFLVEGTAREATRDPPDLVFPLWEGDGLYFFLYPYLLEVQDTTGALIAPRAVTRFASYDVRSLVAQLRRARDAAQQKPAAFEQHIGRQLTPERKELYATVQQEDLLRLIDSLLELARRATREKMGIIFEGGCGA